MKQGKPPAASSVCIKQLSIQEGCTQFLKVLFFHYFSQPMRGIRMMCVAIQKAQQSSTQLTSIHTDLTQVTEFVSVCMVWFKKSYTAVSRKVVAKRARDSPERYCGWFKSALFSKEIWKNGTRGHRHVCECEWKATKVGSTATVIRNSVLIISHITFRDCRLHIFSSNLSRNSCIHVRKSRGLTLQPAGKTGLKITFVFGKDNMSWPGHPSHINISNSLLTTHNKLCRS